MNGTGTVPDKGDYAMSMTLMILAAATAAVLPAASTDANKVRELQTWVDQVNKQIERRIDRRTGMNEKNGLALITFRRGPDGRPMDILVRSANNSLAKIGLMTVRKLRDLPPLPLNLPNNQLVVFKFLVGNPSDPTAHEVAWAKLNASARRANTSFAARQDPSARLASLGAR